MGQKNFKTFKGDFDMFLNKIKNGEHFALSRWGDGELSILENTPIDLLWKGDGEFKHDPNDELSLAMRDVMMKSYTHQDDNYFIGVACPCCVGEEKYQYMKSLSGQPEENLTWANIFVNSNYQHFLNEFLPALKGKKVILIANRKSKNAGLPFQLTQFWSVGTNAWVDDYHRIELMKIKIEEQDYNDCIFLFAAGPLANICTYELWKFRKTNTYIDIGSTLDKFLGLQITRGYLQGAPTLNKTCVW